MELCPVSDTQLPSHCIYKWRAADFDSREPQPQCFRKFWSKKSLKKSKNSMKFQLPQFQLHQHCWKSRTNTQRNWHCLPKPVSSKFLSKLDKKKEFDPLPKPCKPQLRRAWRASFFFGARHWKRRPWKNNGFRWQWNGKTFAIISIITFLRAMASLLMSNWTLWINYSKFCVYRAWMFKKFSFLENYKAFPTENLSQGLGWY